MSVSYDNRSRVANTTDVWNQTIGNTYDANGNRMAMSLGGSGYASYAYDAVNRLTQLTDNAGLPVSYGYDASNRLASRTLPNGVMSTYAYDGLDRLTSLREATPTSVIADSQYSYNTASQIVQQVDPGGAHAYGYDSVDRLASAAYPGATAESYNYDSVGNRTTSHLSPTHGYQPFNQLSSTSTASYAYDSNGDLISKTDSSGTWQYAWDFENRLTQVTRPDAVTISYGYDAVGRRIQRTPSNGEVQKYVYDGQDVVRDLHADGSVALEYLNGPGIDNKIRQTDSANEDLYYATDHLGSTIALTNDLGEMVEGIGYDSFGNSTGSSSTRYTYTGREFDDDTGLYYYRARWYDPQVGRFLTRDPISYAGSINLYSYAANNPLNRADPSGLTGEELVLPAAGALGGGAAMAAAPYVAIGAGYGALLYGAWKFGEWTAEQPWNPFTHPAIPAAPPFCPTLPPVIPFPGPRPRSTPLFPPPPSTPGEICPLKEKVGRICVYECQDGTTFGIWLDDKSQPCPTHAGRTN